MTVNEHLHMYAELKGFEGAEIESKVTEVVDMVGITEKRNAFATELSGGQKRKLSLAIAILGGADTSKLVFLDEPTSGMDPYSRRSTWEMIQVCVCVLDCAGDDPGVCVCARSCGR
jgi:ABC-type multidrug transport system ATPase subunit